MSTRERALRAEICSLARQWKLTHDLGIWRRWWEANQELDNFLAGGAR